LDPIPLVKIENCRGNINVKTGGQKCKTQKKIDHLQIVIFFIFVQKFIWSFFIPRLREDGESGQKKKQGEEEKFVDGKKLMMTSVQQVPLNDRSSMVSMNFF
jgi:hypothetical protein